MVRLLFIAALVSFAAGCAGTAKEPHISARRATWGDRLRGATPSGAGANHAQLLAAFRVLTDAVATVAPQRRAELDRLENACATLARSVDNASARADFVKIGLVAAIDALEADDAVVAITASIDPSKPLAAQYTTIRRALLASAELVDHVPAPITALR
jgi:hypothetical protein